MNSLKAKEQKYALLVKHFQQQLEKEQSIVAYNENMLTNLLQRQDKLDHPQASPKKVKKNVSDQGSSLISKSRVSRSVMSQAGSVIQREKQPLPNHDMEYQMLSTQINKLIDALGQRISTKKSMYRSSALKRSTLTSKADKMLPINSTVSAGMNTSGHWLAGTVPESQINSMSRPELTKHEIGQVSSLQSTDQVVTQLMTNLRAQQNRFVEQTFLKSELAVKSKMKHYIEHLCDKNEESLFKVQQEKKDRELARTESNKETLRRGYTERMKGLVDMGLGLRMERSSFM